MGSGTLLLNLFLDGVTTGAVYALIAVGFSLLWWLADIVHLAHGGIMLAAGYAIFFTVSGLGLPLPLGIVAGLAAAVLLGLAMDNLVYQPMRARGSSEMTLLTASLGALIVLEYGLTLAFGPEGVAIDAGALRAPVLPGILPAVDYYAVVTVAVTLAVFLGLAAFIRHTAIGKAMRAVAENSTLAEVIGLRALHVQRMATIVAAALVTPAAALLLYSNGVAPSDALRVVLIAATIAIIGGRGSIAGALLGGLLVGVAEAVMQWKFSAGWRQMVTFGFLYLILLWRPQGLFGHNT